MVINTGNVLAFVSIKGGVGKTTLALETACALANKLDKRVLLIDANFSAPNIGLYLDLTNELTLHDALNGTLLHNTIYEAHGIDVIPASFDYKDQYNPFNLAKIIKKYRTRYDYIILDSSPNFEELKPVVDAADKIFLVTSPDNVTLRTTLKAGEVAREQDTPVEGIIINKIRSPKHEYDIHEIEMISQIPVLAKIRDHKKMVQALHEKKPIGILDASNTVSQEIESLAKALAGEEEKESFFSRFLPFKDLIHKEKVNRSFYKAQL